MNKYLLAWGVKRVERHALHGEETRDNGHRLKYRTSCLKIRKSFFTIRVIEHWNRLLRDVVQSPPLEIFKSRLDTVLGTLLQLPLLEQGRWPR